MIFSVLQKKLHLQFKLCIIDNVPGAYYHPPAPAPPMYQQQEEKPVKINELTPMIQYSITNLRATGMLDKGKSLFFTFDILFLVQYNPVK